MTSSSSSEWTIISLYPSEMLEEGGIVEKSFHFGSIAGSLGRKQDMTKKPGLNEDAGLVALRGKDYLIAIVVDGHYERDTTEYLLDHLTEQLEEGKWDQLEQEFDTSFFALTTQFSKEILELLQVKEATGEASFIIFALDIRHNRLAYYSVGDLMIFVHDPKRYWGATYQLGKRHFFEWINRKGLDGYHIGFANTSPNMRLILATDGLIDYPTITHEQIADLFAISPQGAQGLVQFGLTNDDDDNITIVYLDLHEHG